jgi:hypothetical protein
MIANIIGCIALFMSAVSLFVGFHPQAKNEESREIMKFCALFLIAAAICFK